MPTTAAKMRSVLKENKQESIKSPWFGNEPVTIRETRNKLHNITSKLHLFCLVNRYSVDHPLAAFKLHGTIKTTFQNTPGAILPDYARRVSGELRVKLHHFSR